MRRGGHPMTLQVGMRKQPERTIDVVVVIGACGWFDQRADIGQEREFAIFVKLGDATGDARVIIDPVSTPVLRGSGVVAETPMQAKSSCWACSWGS